MATKYKIGTISEILRKDAGKASKDFDPKLVALFAKTSTPAAAVVANVPTPKVKARSSGTDKPKKVKLKKKKAKEAAAPVMVHRVDERVKVKAKKQSVHPRLKKNDSAAVTENVQLKNKDAAAIRVQAKARSRSNLLNAEEISPNHDLQSRKKLKKKRKAPVLQDDTISTTSNKERHGKKRKFESSPIGKGVKKRKIKNRDDENSKKFNNDSPEDLDNSSGDEDEDNDTVKPTSDSKSVEKKTLAQRNTPKPKDIELEARTIFVGNLSQNTERKLLKKRFKKYGTIECIRLRCGAPNKPTALKKVAVNRKELHPDNNTLAAFIRYTTRQEAEEAFENSKGLVIDDHHLTVDLADKSVKKDKKKAIFVGNLNLKLTDEELWRFFEICGAIESVRIIRDNETGMGKGFGYVNFKDSSSVLLAIQKNQELLKNRQVRVSRCVKKLKIKKGKIRDTSKSEKTTPGRARNKWSRKEKFPTKKRDSNKVDSGTQEFTGDRLAEIGKLKRKSKKPNRGEQHKARIAKLLTKNMKTTLPVHTTNRKMNYHGTNMNRKKHFN